MADGQIIIETGIDTSGFEKGTKELTTAINSLSNQVKILGEKIESSFGGVCTAAKGAAGDVQEIEKAEKSAAKEAGALEKATAKAGKSVNKAFDDSAVKNTAKEVAKTVKEDMRDVVSDDSLTKYILGDNLSGRINAAFSPAKQSISGFVQSLASARSEEDGMLSSVEILKQSLAALGGEATFKTLTKDLSGVSSSLVSLESLSAKAAGGSASAMDRFTAKADEIREKISVMEQELERLGKQKISTDEYAAIQNQIESDTASLNKLNAAQTKFLETGGKTNSSAYKNRQYQIDELSNSVKYATAELHEMESAGTAFKLGTGTSEYANLAAGINAAKARLTELEDETYKSSGLGGVLKNGLVSALQSVANAAKRAASSVAAIASNAVKSGIKKLGSSIANITKNMLGFKSGSDKTNVSLKKGLNTILKYGFGIRSLYFLFRKLRTAITEAFENLGGYSGEVNSALTSMSNALAVAKNSLATAFAPVVTAVAPYITYLINLLTDAINVIGEFFAALMGSTTYTKVASATGDYTSATEDATEASEDATEAAENQLASFDELNVLSDSSSDSSGSSSSDDSTSGVTYETVSISSAISDWVEALKDAWNAEDFTEVGALIAEKVNEAFEYAYDLISWDNIGDTVTYWVNAICEVFNSLVDNIDWDLIGSTFGAGINTLVNTIDLLLTGIDWENLGASFAECVNGLIDEVDWENIGTMIGDYVAAWADTITGFLLNLDFSGAGEALADVVNSLASSLNETINNTDWAGCAENIASGINSAVKNMDFSLVGDTVGDALVNIFDTLSEFLEDVDWSAIGTGVRTFLVGIDWASVAQAMFEAIGAAIGGLGAFLGGLIGDGFDNIYDYFADAVETCGGDIVSGILYGITQAIADIGTWIYNNVLKPFIDGFCSAFGISSPSTVMMEYGAYIIEGILQGILDGIANIGTWIQNNILDPIADALGLSDLSATVSVALATASQWSSDAWTAIQSAGETFTTTVKGAVKKASEWSSDAWSAITTTAGTITKTVQGAVKKASDWSSDAWSAVQTTASTITKTVKGAVKKASDWSSDAWTAVKQTAGTVTRTLKQALSKSGSYASDAVTAMKSTAGTITRTLKQKLSKSGSYVSDAVTAMKKTAGSVVSTLKQKLTKSGTYNSDALSVVNQTLGSITSTLTQKLKKGTGSNWSSDALDVIQNAASKTITVTVNIASKVASALKTLLGLSTGGVIVGGKVTQFATGGSISRGVVSWWDTVQKYASGTSSAHGTVFVAGEAGPEIVGHVGGRTEVLNKSQLAETMYTAVVNGIGDAINSFWAALSEKMAGCVNAAISSMEYLVTQVPTADNSDLIAVMQTIANTVAYAEPIMATGAITPYATREADIGEIAATLNDGSNAIVSAIGTNTASATAQIVAAIKAYCQTNVTVDAASLTTSIINEINRRTRMSGESPILGVD